MKILLPVNILYMACLLVQNSAAGTVTGHRRPPALSVRPAVMEGRPFLICRISRPPPAGRLLRFRWVRGTSTVTEAVTRLTRHRLPVAGVRLGDRVYCRVESVDGDSEPLSLRSAAEPLGISARIQPTFDGSARLKVKVTSPVVCKTGDGCLLRLKLTQKDDVNGTGSAVILSQCELSFRCSRGRCRQVDGPIMATAQWPATAGGSSGVVQLSIVNRLELGDIWRDYQPPPLHLKLQVAAVAAMCQLVSTNHIIRFDGSLGNLSDSGIFLLYGRPPTALKVSVRSRRCGPAFCVCSITAEDGHGDVTIGACRGSPRLEYHSSRNATDQRARILKIRDRPAWVVQMAGAAVLRVQSVTLGPPVSRTALSAFIATEGADGGRGAQGLCATPGVNDQRRSSDFGPTTARSQWATLHGRPQPVAEWGHPGCLCTVSGCQRPTPPPLRVQPVDPVTDNVSGQHHSDRPAPDRPATAAAAAVSGRRRRRDGRLHHIHSISVATPTRPAMVSSSEPSSSGVPGGDPSAHLEDRCEEQVLRSPQAALCTPVINSSFLNTLLTICRLDRQQYGPLFRTAPPVLSALQDRCEQMTPLARPNGIQAALVANKPQPAGDDLASVSAPESPHLVTCDLSKSACAHLSITGRDFKVTQRMICQIQQPGAHGNTVTDTAIYRSKNELLCRLPVAVLHRRKHTDHVSYWDVRVSPDGGDSWSRPSTLVTFNGDCRHCHLLGNSVTCSRVAGSCVIDGLCYKPQDTSPLDPCRFCNGGRHWATRTGDGCSQPVVSRCSSAEIICEHGLCVEDTGAAICVCEPGYIGVRCEFKEWLPGVKYPINETFDIEELQNEGDELVYSMGARTAAEKRKTEQSGSHTSK